MSYVFFFCKKSWERDPFGFINRLCMFPKPRLDCQTKCFDCIVECVAHTITCWNCCVLLPESNIQITSGHLKLDLNFYTSVDNVLIMKAKFHFEENICIKNLRSKSFVLNVICTKSSITQFDRSFISFFMQSTASYWKKLEI